jgi:hypothetical protein
MLRRILGFKGEDVNNRRQEQTVVYNEKLQHLHSSQSIRMTRSRWLGSEVACITHGKDEKREKKILRK